MDGRRAEIRLACIQNVNGQALTLAKKHAGIKDVREMKGFTFGVPYRFSMHYYLLCLFLAEHGLDPLRDVSIIEVSPPRMPHFIETGRVDGVFAPEPFNQIPVCRGTGFIYTLSKDDLARTSLLLLCQHGGVHRQASEDLPARWSAAFWRRNWPCTGHRRTSGGKSRSN